MPHARPETATQKSVRLKPWRISLIVGWSLCMAASFAWNVHHEYTKVFESARQQLRSNYFRDHTLWLWSTEHGGFYVPVTREQQPSPYLDYLPNRDGVTNNDEKLTLVNPAEALRRFYDFGGMRYGVQGRLSGLKALNSLNDPDAWELAAIESFKKGAKEFSGETTIGNEPYLRLMRPVVMEPGCIRCHGTQGFRLGDVMGGISVAEPVAPLLASVRERAVLFAAGHTVFWLIGILGINVGSHLLERRIEERERAQAALRETEESTRAIMETCLDCIITIDHEDRIMGWTGAAETVFGWSQEEALGQELATTIIPEQYREAHRKGMSRLLRTGEERLINRRIEITALRRGGEEFPVELAIAYLHVAGKPAFAAYVRDISERQASEQQLQRDFLYQRVLNSILETTLEPIPFEQQLAKALDLILEESGLALQSRGAILLRNGSDDELELKVYRGVPQEFLPLGNQMFADLGEVKTGAGEFLNREKEVQGFPLRSRDRLRGGLMVFWSPDHQATQQELDFLTSAAHVLAGLIDRHGAEEQLEHHAYYDQLTGLPNRTLFMDWLGRTVQRAHRRRSHRFAVLFLDFDRFKNINDSLGHTLGDEMLKEVAVRLLRCVRPSDTVARLGGDEFTLLLDDIDEVTDAMRVAERIHEELRTPIRLDEHEIFATASVGIAINSSVYESPDEVLRDADIAMYQAKNEGPGNTKVFNLEMHTSAVALLRTETELRHALERDELVVYYQPIVQLRSMRIEGFEALVRWQHPRRGLVSPGEFIEVAEETGLIVPVGLRVLRSACEQISSWNEQRLGGGSSLYVTVNLSGIQLLHPNWLAQLDEVLVETGCSTGHLRLELTESVLMKNAQLTSQVLLGLKKRGLRLYLDDFGTGYSSLSYLHRFPFDALKIDRSFVKNLPLGEEHVALFRAFKAIGEHFGMDVVAEGVESDLEWEEVRRLGCDAVQGFRFGRPVSAAEIESLFAEQRCAFSQTGAV